MTKETEFVHLRWLDLTAQLATDPELASRCWEGIAKAYLEPHRKYHNLRHIAQVIEGLEKYGAPSASSPAAYWTAMYHDVIYDPQRPDNEPLSAERANVELSELGASADLRNHVVQMILATSNHFGAEATGEAALFLDCDLLILGAAPGDYSRYSEAIRQEYAFVPDSLFRAGRKSILERFMAAPRIFRTDAIHDRFEEQARENMATELKQLAVIE